MKSNLILLVLLAWFTNTCLAIENDKANVTGFIENKGQVTDQNYHRRNDIQFKIATPTGLNIFIGKAALHYQFTAVRQQPRNLKARWDNTPRAEDDIATVETYRMDVELIGANINAEVLKESKQDYYENYYTAAAGDEGITVGSYGKIIYKNIYPNIDWVLYSKGGTFKHEFIIREGGNVADIRLKYSGATSLYLNKDGSLTAITPKGDVTEHAPHSFTTDGVDVYSSYRLQNNILSYATGSYKGTLVIDPSIDWATYFGAGNNSETTTKAAGNSIYIAGGTASTTNIATTGAHQTTFAGHIDGFITKFKSDGTLLWSTYFGGSGFDYLVSMDVDASDNLYVTGYTWSPNGIATAGSFVGGNYDAMLVKFNTGGMRLWGRYIGDMGDDYGYGVACNSGGVYVAGHTYCDTNIATPGTHQPTFIGTGIDAFLLYYDSSGTKQMGTYFGGDFDEHCYDVKTDLAGNAYIAGFTNSDNGIASPGSYQNTLQGSYDIFIAKFNVTGILQWSTYFGGNNRDWLKRIAMSNTGDIYAIGTTNSTSGIATAGCHQPAMGGGNWDIFVAKFDNTGTPQWATYYGGNELEYPGGIEFDASGKVVFSGYTASTSNIATIGSYQPLCAGGEDAFISIFDAAGTRQWATYYGGNGGEWTNDMATDNLSNIYLAGFTSSDSGIATAGSHQPVRGNSGGYLAKFSSTMTGIQTIVKDELNVYPNPANGVVTVRSKAIISKVDVVDIMGRKVLTQASNSNRVDIDIQQLSAGVYLLKVNDEYTAKIIKQ